MNTSLSLALIVKDEETVLRRCLDSIKNIVDEIIIVDTGSTDRTKEIALEYTDRVFDFKWIDDFSAARNFSFEKCTGDFILWLDADDEVRPEDAAKIKALDLSDKEIIICNYEYAHDEFGRSICTVPRERIIKRSLGLQWQEPIHEYLPIRHQIFVSDISVHHFKKHGTSERNLAILERIVKGPNLEVEIVGGASSRNIYYLGKEYMDAGRTDDALFYLTKYVERGDGFWEDVYRAWYQLAQCYREKKDDGNFKQCLFESLKIEERRAEPYCLMGEWHMDKQQWDRAIQWFELALVIKRPKDLLASYQPEYYTWVPCLQLCVCYNAIGDIKKAYENNRKVLEYRPQDSRALNNDRILKSALESKKNLPDGQGKRLNLGCGGKPMPGYVNVDIFKGDRVDEVFDLYEIPYADNTIGAIHSEHALEHVGHARSLKALREWYRVLRPGGELILKIPDLEQCCRKYVDTPVENEKYKLWYKQTIYGYQQSLAGEPDEAQIHRWGFSKAEIESILRGIGFICDYSEHYDGWDTPSVGGRYVKPVSDLKIGWICGNGSQEWKAAQTRLRVLNVNRWLQSKGYQSNTVNYPDIINGGYDVAIVGKTFDEHHLKNIRMLKQHGKTVYCDLCEDLTGWAYVNEILAACDRIICCSRKLEEKVKPINPNTVVIEDAWER